MRHNRLNYLKARSQSILKNHPLFFLLILFGVITRLILIPHPGFEADIAYWKGWGLAVGDKGLLWLVKNTNFNYPPGFAYVLYFIHKLYALFSNPYEINVFWLNTNILYLSIIKLVTIISDLLMVFLIIQFGKIAHTVKLAIIASLIYFLHPAVFFDGPIWGQVDQYGLTLFSTAVYLLFRKRTFSATVIFTISFLMKLQNIIFIPLYFLYIFRQSGPKKAIQSCAVSAAVFILVSAPFFIFHEFPALFRLLTVNSDWFPFYSLNAFNIWWLASGLQGLTTVDKQLVFGILNAKQLGLLMFSFTYLIGVIVVYKANSEKVMREFIAACCLVVFAFFHLLTQSHERYLFHLIGLLLLLTFFDGKKNVVKSFIIYTVFSVLFFFNMYIAFYFNYPHTIFFPFSKESAMSISAVIAICQIAVFAVFFVMFFLRDAGNRLLQYVFVLGCFCLVIVFKNIPYYVGRPILLTKIAPIEKSQDYQTPQIHKTVDSATGPFAGFRLSTNYYFYDHGIGSHADSRLVYGLGGRFSSFVSDFAVDTEASGTEKLIFIVEADGRELFRSEPRAKFDKPGQVRLDITGVDRLVLRIVSPSGSKAGAHADWLDPTLIR